MPIHVSSILISFFAYMSFLRLISGNCSCDGYRVSLPSTETQPDTVRTVLGFNGLANVFTEYTSSVALFFAAVVAKLCVQKRNLLELLETGIVAIE